MKTLPCSLSCLALMISLSGCTQAAPATTATDAPSASTASRHCQITAPRSLQLDLAGVQKVAFEVGRHTLHLTGAADGNGLLSGKDCASSDALLKGLSITQQRNGSVLTVRMEQSNSSNVFLGNGKGRYAYMDATVALPAHLAVQLAVGSGDATVNGLESLSAAVSSGDLAASRIKGPVVLTLSSGDVQLQDIASLQATVSSGDLLARQVTGTTTLTVSSGDARLTDAGPVRITALSSGDIELSGIKGDVAVEAVSSGDLEIDNVSGNVTVGTLGSGGIVLKRIGGEASVKSIGSGDLEVDGAAALTVQRIGSGDVSHRHVTGPVTLPSAR